MKITNADRPGSSIAAAVLALFLSGISAGADLVITNARVFTATDTGVLENANLVITGNRIEAVSPGEATVHGARVIDAGGRTVIPGLIDAHVHLFFDLQGEPYFPTSDEEAAHFVQERMQEKLEALLNQGFTSVLSPIDFWPQIIDVRDRIAAGDLSGPRLFVGGGVFVAPGGHYICRRQPEARRRWCDEHISVPVGNAAQAREGVARYSESGVDLIVYDSLTNAPALPGDVVTALVSEAHRRGLPVLVHGSDAHRFNYLVQKAGVDGFVHPPGGDRDADGRLAGMAGDRKIPLGITIGEAEEALRKNELAPEEVAAYTATRSNVRELLSNGAMPVFASDMPGADPANTLPIVLRSLSDLGLDNADVLLAATRYAAHGLLGRHDLGTLEVGQLADIVIVDADPLADLQALRKIYMVIKDGRVAVDNCQDCNGAYRALPE